MSNTIEENIIHQMKTAAMAVARGLCPDENMQITFLSAPPRSVGTMVYLREPYVGMDVTGWRAQNDQALLKNIYYKPVIAAQYRPKNIYAADLYEKILCFFAEYQGIIKYNGIASNLKTLYHRQKEDLEKRIVTLKTAQSVVNTDKYIQILILYFDVIDSVLLDCLSINKDTKPSDDVNIPDQYLGKLKETLHHFEGFCHYTNKLCEYLFERPADVPPLPDCDDCKIESDVVSLGEDNIPDLHEQEDITTENFGETEEAPPQMEALNQDITQSDSHDSPQCPDDAETFNIEFTQDDFADLQINDFVKYQKDYHIFTKEFDLIKSGKNLITDHEDHKQLYDVLEQSVTKHKKIITKLSAKLRAKLLSYQSIMNDSGAKDGILDTQSFSNLIINPLFEDYFQKENTALYQDIAVTLLIDCSGSMRGNPMKMAATSAFIITDILDKCKVSTEILGFTTDQWRGGESKKSWEKIGAPPFPGRMNDLLHIVVKPGNIPWRNAKYDMGILLKDSLLKENIDGEALLWAHDRLLKQAAHRRILLVISDGAPLDDQTLSANDSGFLERHLCQSIEYIEKKSPVELLAIGIGHDVTQYYKKAVTLKNSDTLSQTLIQELINLFDQHKK